VRIVAGALRMLSIAMTSIGHSRVVLASEVMK
jgi:hypothetical protein